MSFIPKSEKNNWYSIPLPSGDESIAPYCIYCYNNYRKYYELVENICTMCGKPAPQILKNETINTEITAVNDDPPTEMIRGASMEIIYEDLFKDETITPGHGNTRMNAVGIGEAMRMLKQSEVPRKVNTIGFQGKYKVKIPEKKIARFDNNTLE